MPNQAPYAPLGGCYDDPVVQAVGTEIVKKGFVLGTFNFRYVLNWLSCGVFPEVPAEVLVARKAEPRGQQSQN